ncbi:ion transport peptide-like [Trichonephila clavata]|uniref:Ion transport peptide-like n=1 Tax=Trichonephila clavata TaxID=2740835 RepID=A0A8X6FXI1_TRICU|nr:ion transport peptide-like [Trichonephila clavata]
MLKLSNSPSILKIPLSSQMNFVTIALSLAALSATMFVHADEEVERTYIDFGCLDILDKSMFARMDFVCDECFRKSDQLSACRSNCFKNDYFVRCVDAVLLRKDQHILSYLASQLYRRRK